MRRFSFAAAALLAFVPCGVRARVSVAPVLQPVFGASVHLLDPSRYPTTAARYARQPLPDAQPAVAITDDGTVWVAAIHVQYGTALWSGQFAQTTPQFMGMSNRGIGGDNVALAVGTGTPANLYVLSLTLPVPSSQGGLAAGACPGALTGAAQPCVFQPHTGSGQHDRPWLAPYGHSTLYISFMARGENALPGNMTVLRSDDGNRTSHRVGDPVAGLTGVGRIPIYGWPGPIVADRRSGAVYQVFVVTQAGQKDTARFNRLVVAVSHNGGVTWRDRTIYQGAPGEDDANMWPGLAVDGGGALYAAWSDRRDVYLSSSLDGGTTWSRPARVDIPSAALRTSVEPSVVAGAAGRVALAWYGTDARDNLTAGARWRVVFAESSDGGHTFAQTFATGTIHQGPVCTKGDLCPWERRQLLDLLGLALDPRTGRAAIAYSRSIEFGDYQACRRAANCPQTYYLEETAH